MWAGSRWERQIGFQRYKSSFLSLRYERYAKLDKADMSVKLGGYGSKRENAKP